MQKIKHFFSTLTTKKAVSIIVLVGILVFFNSLFNGFVGDDRLQILDNSLIHSIGNIGKFFSGASTFANKYGGQTNYYKPVLSTIFSIIYTVFGNNAIPFHAVQLLVHIANSLLIFFIFKYFFKNQTAFFLSLFFLIHPINAEAVVYISSLQDNLFLFFGLLALNLVLKELDKVRFYVLEAVLLLLALLSKETGVTFLLIIPLFSFLFRRRKFLKHLTVSISAMGFYLFLRFGVAHMYFNNPKIVPIMTLQFLQRIINIPKIIFFYLKTFFYPRDLLIFQTWVVDKTNFQDFYLPLVLGFAFFAALAVFGLVILKRGNLLSRIFLFFLLWFIIGLGFHLQIIPLDVTVADRWFYFPIVGLLGLMGVFVEYLRLKKLNIPRSSIIILLVVLVLTFGIRVMVRNRNWKNNLTLASHDIQANTNSHLLEDMLGSESYQLGNIDEAEAHYINSTKIFPSPMTFTNLGWLYLNTHRPEKAKGAFETSIKLGDSYGAYTNYAALLTFNESPELAENFINDALEKFPDSSELWLDLGIVKFKQGKKEDSISSLERAYLLNPSENVYFILNAFKSGQKIEFKEF